MIDRKNLLEDLKNKKYNSLYLVYGKETYLIEEVEKIIKNATNIDMSDFNLSVMDGKELRVASLVSSIDTLPFMSEYRVVVVKDAEFLKVKKSITKDEEDELIKILGNMPSSTILLFTVLGDVDKKKSLYRIIEKNGVVCEMKNLDDISLLNWCKYKFEEKKVQIRPSEITYFIEMSGYRDKNSQKTLSDLENEINKMCSFVGDEKSITKDVIDELTKSKIENDIFLLIDMIVSKNSKRALKILDDMIDDGSSVLGIMSLLYTQLSLILQIKTLSDRKYRQDMIVNALNIKEYRVKKLSRYMSNFSYDTILEIQNYIVDNDFKIKQGKVEDRLAMEILIFKFCNKNSK